MSDTPPPEPVFSGIDLAKSFLPDWAKQTDASQSRMVERYGREEAQPRGGVTRLVAGNLRVVDSRIVASVMAAGIVATPADNAIADARMVAGIVTLVKIGSMSPHPCCSGGLRQ